MRPFEMLWRPVQRLNSPNLPGEAAGTAVSSQPPHGLGGQKGTGAPGGPPRGPVLGLISSATCPQLSGQPVGWGLPRFLSAWTMPVTSS